MTPVCETADGERLAVRLVSCEGEGAYPYCQECAELLLRHGGESDRGPVSRMTDTDPVVEIGAVPNRKRKALGLTVGSTYRVLAYFVDDEAYERFRAAVGERARLKWIDEGGA